MRGPLRSDKPDLRFGMELVDLTKMFAGSGLKMFAEAAGAGHIVKALKAPGCASYSAKSWIFSPSKSRRRAPEGCHDRLDCCRFKRKHCQGARYQ